jgi:hypothetical protein
MKNKIQKILTEAMNQYDDFWNAVWSGNSMSHRAVIEKYFPPFAHLKGLPHNPEKHPEGDVDVHVFLVIDAVASEKDKDLSLAAVFHDLGKSNTLEFNEKTGQPTYKNHEKFSTDYVRYYRDLIEAMGADYFMVIDLVDKHMKYHRRDEMKASKVQELENSHYSEKLKKLGAADHDSRYVGRGEED